MPVSVQPRGARVTASLQGCRTLPGLKGGSWQQGPQLYLASRVETDDNTSDARHGDRGHRQAEVNERLVARRYQLARFIS